MAGRPQYPPPATEASIYAAARAMLASDTAAQASIQEITNTADVGFGSFYNHLSGKAELFEAAVADVLDELGALLDQLSVDVDDPALAFARSVRLTLRLCRSRPEMAAVLIGHGMHYMESPRGLAHPRCATSRPASLPAAAAITLNDALDEATGRSARNRLAG